MPNGSAGSDLMRPLSPAERHAMTPEGRNEAAAAESGQPITTPSGLPSDQWFSDPSGPLYGYGLRYPLIAANQLFAGIPQLPAAGARFAWNLGREAGLPIGPPPERLSPDWTVPGLTPSTGPERVVGAGFRAAGTALPFEGPRGAAITGLGSAVGQTVREVGGPEWLATGADVLGGTAGASRNLLSSASPAGAGVSWLRSRMGGTPMAAVAPTAAAATRAGHGLESGIFSNIIAEPFTQYMSSLHPLAGIGTSAAIGLGGYLLGGRGALGFSAFPNTYAQLAATAGRILGGYTIGQTVAGQAQNQGRESSPIADVYQMYNPAPPDVPPPTTPLAPPM
jgi:hypothetical protein